MKNSKIIAILLSLVLVGSNVSVPVMAAEINNEEVQIIETETKTQVEGVDIDEEDIQEEVTDEVQNEEQETTDAEEAESLKDDALEEQKTVDVEEEELAGKDTIVERQKGITALSKEVGIETVATGIVVINEANFPDQGFRNKIKKFDLNGDGVFDSEEIAAIKEIHTSGGDIFDNLKGIEFFTELESLSCARNEINGLDISKNVKLVSLNCSNNNISSLDVSKNTKLETLICSSNDLSSLDVSKNTALSYLSCSNNNLSSLNVSVHLNLTSLDCKNNKLSNLDVSKNTKLGSLICSSNNLSSLDISKNTALSYLSCSDNNLSSLNVATHLNLSSLNCSKNKLSNLDVSKNIKLDWLVCSSNNLSSLDVNKNTALFHLECSDNNLSSLSVSSAGLSLAYLDCSKNKLSNLDLGKNTRLGMLMCSSNNLSHLDLSKNTNLSYFVGLSNSRTVQGNTLDTKTLSGFSMSKASGWTNASVSGTKVTVKNAAKQITYTYDCGRNMKAIFTLNVKSATQTITAKSLTKAYGDKAFLVGAKRTTGDGKLTYVSSDEKVANISSTGMVTIKGTGKTTISITAAATSYYKKTTKKITITVKPKKAVLSSLKSSAKKKATVKWKKDSQATGYQIQYSTSSSFAKSNKTKNITKNSIVSNTLTSLTRGKKYHVRIRSYKKINGEKVYGSWSAKKSVKIK